MGLADAVTSAICLGSTGDQIAGPANLKRLPTDAFVYGGYCPPSFGL